MKKVITYGTYDLLHQGHINLLKRAKELGDYLIVGVTNDSFDLARGKLNVRDNVLERVEAVRATGLADQIIIEDYIGQKINDIQKYNVDIFAVGSDWEGHFDYLNDYCEVVYLPRTEGISSTMLREKSNNVISVGVSGCGRISERFVPEITKVSSVFVKSLYDADCSAAERISKQNGEIPIANSFEEMVETVDAVYIATPHLLHYEQAKYALEQGKHVLCETPLVLYEAQAQELFDLAKSKNLVLLEANKTAFCPAFNHLIMLVKSGQIGEVVGMDASISKLWDKKLLLRELDPKQAGGSLFEMGSYTLLPILKLLGLDIKNINFYSKLNEDGVDVYTRGIARYDSAVASFQLGLGVKTEGSLIVSGTKGYAYVPSPWWKTDYFELRFEDQNQNKKYFYAWNEPGLRYEIQEFASCIVNGRINSARLTPKESIAMAKIMQQYVDCVNIKVL